MLPLTSQLLLNGNGGAAEMEKNFTNKIEKFFILFVKFKCHSHQKAVVINTKYRTR